MESDRMKLMAEERKKLEEEKAQNPHLFPDNLWIDDNPSLEPLGIYIPNKEKLPKGFLKLIPGDFIVEEITLDGRQTTILKEEAKATDQEGDTVYATLVKCGLSTLEAVDEIAKALGTTKDKVQYAGIKDKDAITSQEISIRGVKKEAVSNIRSPHFFLKEIRTGKGVVDKGRLTGNRFTILIRMGEDLKDEDKIESSLKAIDGVRNNGFYNFFYLQRFGTPRLNNFKWGILLLRGEYEKAVYSFISDQGLREIPYFLNMRKEIISFAPNWSKVLERLREFQLIFPSEIRVVEHLVQNPTDFIGALKKIEDQVGLWVSALASLLYNRKLSAYIMAGINPPKELPLLTSPDRNDWLTYIDDLEGAKIFPPNFGNIRHFRSIMLKHREIKTVDKAEVHKVEVTEDGIILQFALGKGEYATTFLSHFVNLLNGKATEDIDTSIVDTKKILGDEDVSETLKHFEELNQYKV